MHAVVSLLAEYPFVKVMHQDLRHSHATMHLSLLVQTTKLLKTRHVTMPLLLMACAFL